MEFIRLNHNRQQIEAMSLLATAIVREHFDPLIGEAQNTYMISLFQTPEAILNQMNSGSRYYFVQEDGKTEGFLAFYPKEACMYLSKFYLQKQFRGKGKAKEMFAFVKDQARKENLHAVELNVNRDNSAVQVYEHLGFRIVRCEKNDIGHGYYMDDYVLRIDF